MRLFVFSGGFSNNTGISDNVQDIIGYLKQQSQSRCKFVQRSGICGRGILKIGWGNAGKAN